jgi:hypothetical protein
VRGFVLLFLCATASAQKPEAPAQPAQPELNFDLFDEKKPAPPSPEELLKKEHLEKTVKLRRALLTSHQALGFATLGVMAVTLIIGQLDYQDKFARDGTYTQKYENAHLGLAVATTGLFAATGVTALVAPNPYPKPIKFDAAFVHKGLGILATAGMVAQLILGPVAKLRAGQLDERDIVTAHLAIGYVTWAALFGQMLTFMVK